MTTRSSALSLGEFAALCRLHRLRLAMAGLAIAGLTACGGGDDEPQPPAPPSGSTPAPSPAPTPSPTPSPPPAPSPTPSPPPPPTASDIAVQGQFRGPIGAQVTLQNNGGDDIVVTVGASPAGADYAAQAFTFATPLPTGSTYAVTVTAAPVGHTCRVVSGASGTVPAAQAITVGCERDADLVSRNDDDTAFGTFGDSRDVLLAGDETTGEGRFTVFVTSARDMAAGNDSAFSQVYWRDRLTGRTSLVSRTVGGSAGNGNSYAAAVSADGQTVVFESVATNLAAVDTNVARDVYAWTAASGTVRLLSIDSGGRASYDPSISGDGRVVAFTSDVDATSANVFRADMASLARTLVSKHHTTNAALGLSGWPSLSHDGSRLAFHSYARDLVSDDGNGSQGDVFVHDAAAGTMTRVSLGAGGVERQNADSNLAPTISGNGRYVAYPSRSNNIVANDTNGVQDVFVVDTQTGVTVRASETDAGVGGDGHSPLDMGVRVSLSHDGHWVAFRTAARNLGAGSSSRNALARNWVTGQVIAPGEAGPGVAISKHAAYVAFLGYDSLDARFTQVGHFALYTGIGNAWWWTLPN